MKILQLLKDVFIPKQEEKEERKAVKDAANTDRPEGSSAEAKYTRTGDYKELIEGLVSGAGYGNYTPVGVTGAVCPSCGNKLEKIPPRKIQCASCSEDIFVRTRESDKRKVLLNRGQLDEFERQKIFDSGKYDRRVAKLIEDMTRYSETGGWIFISALSDQDSPEFIEHHGRVFKTGTEEEIDALKLLIRPESRARTKTWFNDPEKDTDWKEYEQQKKEWFDNHK